MPTSTSTARPAHQVFGVKFAEHPKGTRGEYFHGSAAAPRDAVMPMDYFVWLIRTEAADIVVDVGFTPEMANRRLRTYFRRPSEALALLDVDCATVPWVVLSHFHYDHVGEVAAFPNARFVVQEREMAFWTGRFATRREFHRLVEGEDIVRLVELGLNGRLHYVDGEVELVPGVGVHLVGGHTAGTQVVSVATARGTVVLAADASHFFGNVCDDVPFAVHTDLPDTYGAFDTMHRLAGAPELIVPGHDPEVLTRFTPVDGLTGTAVRIA
ncbi:N-acyl homoserine lactonase family protein [Nocardia miyunensis]|uniref:N-acyl homoserine lactonase family protein n=1 Tax=Nocardia miyunensis TaxID=282684 RepID=UPI000831055F|nr:N-acyl homoserine lactonase family protein [Nocardia miyunensis]